MSTHCITAAVAICISLAVAVPGKAAYAHDPAEPAPRTDSLATVEDKIVETLKGAMTLLSTAIGAVVPYELPEVLPNGDIIIRRKTNGPLPAPEREELDKGVRL